MGKNKRLVTTFARKQSVIATGLALSLMCAHSAYAQQTPAVDQKIEKIEVTGSNIKRIEGEGSVPVTVVKREDIERTGVTSAADLLDKLQLNSGANYNLSQGVGDSGQPGFSGASLRGLGPNNTLILLNGRRLANYAFNGAAVDVNSIPIAAIERVEILKDGASAIYGTDAIGGVINFILRNDYRGIEGSYYKTNTKQGGGNTEKYSLTGGFGSLDKDHFNVLVSLDKEKSDPLAAKQRSFAKTGIRPDLDVVKTSGNSYPANIRFGPGRGNPTAVTGCLPSAGSYFIIAQSNRNCRYDYTSVLDIFPPVDRQSAVARATFQLNASTQVFGEYTYTKNKTVYASSETPINDFSDAGNRPIIFPATSPYYPAPYLRPNGTIATPTGDLAIAWRGKDAGRRTDRSTAEQSRIVAGIKGNVGSWDYEGAFNRAESKVTDTYIDGWLSEARLRAALLTGLINPFTTAGQNAAGQAALNSAKILQDIRSSKGSVTSVDAKATTELMQMAAGPLALAVGAESRKEKFADRPSPVQSSGDILGGGGNYPGATADRKVNAVFAELSIPLAKNFEATVAVRSDRYSDFGNSTNPKVAFRWTPDKSVLFRGSFNTGFRAPSLPDLYVPLFNSNTADAHNDPIRCPNSVPIGTYVQDTECDAQFVNKLGGNRNLKPEKSRQYSIGMVLEPQPGTSIGIDFFNITRTNSLGSLGDNTLFDNYAKYGASKFVRFGRLADGSCSNDALGAPTPANVPCAISYVLQFTENLGEYRQSGLDLTASKTHSTEFGKFRVSLDGTYITKYKYQREVGGAFFNNLAVFTSDNGAIPRWRHVLAINWSMGPWGATLSQNYVSGYQDDTKDATVVRDVGQVETYDFQGVWSGFKGLQLVLGIRNLLDRDPPASRQGQTFQVGYDPRYGDPLGRTYYGKISYAFK